MLDRAQQLEGLLRREAIDPGFASVVERLRGVLAELGPADAREFHRRIFTARNTLFFATGDLKAADILKRVEAGFGDRFGHGTGHGVGLEVHERPSVNQRSRDTLESGNVVTIEPGVYLPGRGGIRIEQDVVVEASEQGVWWGRAKVDLAFLQDVPVPAIIFVIEAVIAAFVLRYSRYGQHVYATGGNKEAAKLNGISTDRIIFSVYVIMWSLLSIALSLSLLVMWPMVI